MENLISVEHLYRYYGANCAVRDVSFELDTGQVLGFLGPNGAGKSTTMQILSGNLAPSAGRVQIDGIDLLDRPKRAKCQLGYLPEQPPLYRELTVDEYLWFCARLHRIARKRRGAAVATAKERCGLTEVGRRLIGNLSKGYQQRVGIAQAIIHNPQVVILDEPTVGLDPIQIREIRALIRELGREHGIILSTHILPEVQAVCTHVQIIHQGALVFADSIAGLNARMQGTHLLIGLRQPPPLETLQSLPGVVSVEVLDDGRLRVGYGDNPNPAESLTVRATLNGWGLYEIAPERMTLEQIFVDLTCTEQETTEAIAA